MIRSSSNAALGPIIGPAEESNDRESAGGVAITLASVAFSLFLFALILIHMYLMRKCMVFAGEFLTLLLMVNLRASIKKANSFVRPTWESV